METTRLSSKGQIIIPKLIRDTYDWGPGTEFYVLDTSEGVLLKPKKQFPESKLEDVAGILAYEGPAKSLEEMEEGIKKGIQEMWRASN